MNNFTSIEHEGQKVLTTEQLAQAYECKPSQIKQNFNNNIEKFEQGVHYFKLEGAELKGFKNQVENFDLVNKNASSLYLWTRRGASRHCKMLGTDKSWDMFDELEETYFNKEQSLPKLSPQLQVLINLEMEQKRQAQKLNQVNTRIDKIKDVLSLGTPSWRENTNKLIVKIAQARGGNDCIHDVRTESYEILDSRMGVCIGVRLINLKRRLSAAGATLSDIRKANYLDVIGQDKKLVEGYMAVVKDMAIKYIS